jgi:carbon-monoxide dehydrogenase large subunit
MELAELAALEEDGETGVVAHCTYDPPKVPYSSAAHLALVEVDRETGGVKVLRYVVAEDCGAMIDPQAVEGQVRGGVAQGIGSALLEEMVYDAEGQLLSASLADYLLPGTTDIPKIEIVHRESADADVKGVGESGTIGAPAAIAGAVLDALECEPEEIVLPLAPERVRSLAMRGR